MLSRFGYLRGHFQKQLRKVEAAPSGSRRKLTTRWEYFQACSFLRPFYSNLSNIPSSELRLEGELYEGSLEDLEGEPSTSCSSFTLLTPSPTASESPGDAERLAVTTNNSEKPTALECEGTPPAAKKQKIVNKSDPVRDSLVETLNVVQTKFHKEEHFITKCVRNFMQYIPESCPKETERCAKLKEKFTEEVMQLIKDKIRELHREPAQDDQ